MNKWYIREDGKFEGVEELADRADLLDYDALLITNQLASNPIEKDDKGYYVLADELK